MFQFSEAARLYARDFQIVDSVKRQFDQDVKSFLDAVRDEVRSLRKPEMKEKVQPTGNRFWWLSGASEKNPLQLWLEAKKTHAAIIKDEKLQFSAVANEAPAEKQRIYVQFQTRPEIAHFCQPTRRGGSWSLFDVTVPCPKDDPVSSVARDVAKILSVLFDAQKVADGI